MTQKDVDGLLQRPKRVVALPEEAEEAIADANERAEEALTAAKARAEKAEAERDALRRQVDDFSSHPLVRSVWMKWIACRASENLDKWGVQDFETLGLAVCEEAGELAQAILKNKHEGGECSRITHEALDLASLCVQVLVTMVENHGVENVIEARKVVES